MTPRDRTRHCMPIKTPRPSVRALKRRNSARSLCSAIRIFILPALLAVAGFCQTLPVDGDTLLLLRFEGTLNGVQGQAPQSASGVQFVPGLVGQGVNLTAGSQVIFSAANNISASEGTLEFWIKPNWNGNNGTSNYVLSWGQQGGMLFGKDSYPNWRMIANRFKTEIGVATSASGWQAGQWKHAAFTWSGTALCLYLNGVLVIQQNVSSALPAVSAATFQLGGDGSNVIDAVLDELRISRRARTSAEIQSDFATALPALDNTSGQVTTLVSSGLVGPWGVAVDGPGNVYIGDRGNNTIKIITR